MTNLVREVGKGAVVVGTVKVMSGIVEEGLNVQGIADALTGAAMVWGGVGVALLSETFEKVKKAKNKGGNKDEK